MGSRICCPALADSSSLKREVVDAARHEAPPAEPVLADPHGPVQDWAI